MARLHIGLTDLETALRFRMALSSPPRSREDALSPGDTAAMAVHFGAYIDGEIVGVCSIGSQPLPVLDHPEAWRLRGMMVLPDLRNRGIGPALLKHQLREVDTKPNPFAWSYVQRRQAPFFAHHGYRPTGYTYQHPVSGETLLFGNEHTLRLIQDVTGITYSEGDPPNLGAVKPAMSNTQEMVRRFIVDRVVSGAQRDQITADTPLNENGLLDSMATTQLVLFLEQEFHIEIQEDDLVDGRLSSLASIEQLVADRQAGLT